MVFSWWYFQTLCTRSASVRHLEWRCMRTRPDAVSQLMCGDVTKTKPCALARRRSAERPRVKSFCKRNGHTFGVHGDGKVRLASPRLFDSRELIPSSLSGVARVLARSRREPGGCRSYPRTGAARARNGWKRSKAGKRRRSSSAPTTKPSRFSYGESLFLIRLFPFLVFLPVSPQFLCPLRGDAHGTQLLL